MLNTPEERNDFVVRLQASPELVRQDVVATALATIDDSDSRSDAVAHALRSLPTTDQAKALQRAGLGTPSKGINDRLWIIIIFALIILIFLLLIALIWQSQQVGDNVDYLKNIITLALGAIIGLVAPAATRA